MDVGKRAHLTIRWGRHVQGDDIDDHGHEGGKARKGISLPMK
jgi:hypothetical protein